MDPGDPPAPCDGLCFVHLAVRWRTGSTVGNFSVEVLAATKAIISYFSSIKCPLLCLSHSTSAKLLLPCLFIDKETKIWRRYRL